MVLCHPTRFEHRTAVITAAGNPAGIGTACARNMGRSGAHIALVSSTDEIEQRAAELRARGIRARGYVCDLTDRDQVASLAESIRSDMGSIDVLVNDACWVHAGFDRPFASLSPAEQELAIERNLGACFNVTRALVGEMVVRGYGRIVNISSVTGPQAGDPDERGLSAMKAAMLGMCHGLARELAPQGVTVNCVAPGWIESGHRDEVEQAAALQTPIGRLGTSAEVADLVAFLTSDEAAYITGQMVGIDGGESAGFSEFLDMDLRNRVGYATAFELAKVWSQIETSS